MLQARVEDEVSDKNVEETSPALPIWMLAPLDVTENAHIESFNGRLRDECLNATVFVTLADAKAKLETWRLDYNEHRPHSSIGNLTPAEFSKKSQRNRTA